MITEIRNPILGEITNRKHIGHTSSGVRNLRPSSRNSVENSIAPAKFVMKTNNPSKSGNKNEVGPKGNLIQGSADEMKEVAERIRQRVRERMIANGELPEENENNNSRSSQKDPDYANFPLKPKITKPAATPAPRIVRKTSVSKREVPKQMIIKDFTSLISHQEETDESLRSLVKPSSHQRQLSTPSPSPKASSVRTGGDGQEQELKLLQTTEDEEDDDRPYDPMPDYHDEEDITVDSGKMIAHSPLDDSSDSSGTLTGNTTSDTLVSQPEEVEDQLSLQYLTNLHDSLVSDLTNQSSRQVAQLHSKKAQSNKNHSNKSGKPSSKPSKDESKKKMAKTKTERNKNFKRTKSDLHLSRRHQKNVPYLRDPFLKRSKSFYHHSGNTGHSPASVEVIRQNYLSNLSQVPDFHSTPMADYIAEYNLDPNMNEMTFNMQVQMIQRLRQQQFLKQQQIQLQQHRHILQQQELMSLVKQQRMLQVQKQKNLLLQRSMSLKATDTSENESYRPGSRASPKKSKSKRNDNLTDSGSSEKDGTSDSRKKSDKAARSKSEPSKKEKCDEKRDKDSANARIKRMEVEKGKRNQKEHGNQKRTEKILQKHEESHLNQDSLETPVMVKDGTVYAVLSYPKDKSGRKSPTKDSLCQKSEKGSLGAKKSDKKSNDRSELKRSPEKRSRSPFKNDATEEESKRSRSPSKKDKKEKKKRSRSVGADMGSVREDLLESCYVDPLDQMAPSHRQAVEMLRHRYRFYMGMGKTRTSLRIGFTSSF